MKYIVLEIQSGNTISTIVNDYDNINQAESKYHQILTTAATSDVLKHSAMIIDDEGHLRKVECYTHED